MQGYGFMGLRLWKVEEAHAVTLLPLLVWTLLNILWYVHVIQVAVEALPPLSVDEPTVTIRSRVNNFPFCRKEGKFCYHPTNPWRRLDRE